MPTWAATPFVLVFWVLGSYVTAALEGWPLLAPMYGAPGRFRGKKYWLILGRVGLAGGTFA